MMRTLAVGVILFVGVLTARNAAAAPVDYVKQIKPLLKHHCVSCHGPLRQKGRLRVDAVVFLRKGGDTGPAIVSGKPDESVLIAALTGKGGVTRMPMEGKPFSPAESALIRRWITEGAIAPKDESFEKNPRDHWAFRAPVRPAVPKTGSRNPIDAFIAAKLKTRDLTPQPAAEKHILLRRVHLDLVGLPPTPKELQAFLNDDAPNAYENVVDRLLKSPQYGERWGRHWMDVWRYSDWYGYRAELRNSTRHIWRWRDYIVESLNKDRPYDGMIVDMLAADEHSPADRDRLRATGFLARNYYVFNRDKWLDSTIEHTGKAFLGLTLNCARCHDHKYDPIEQTDYYKFRAIFEPHLVRTDRVPGQPDIKKDGLSLVYDAKLDAKTYLYERGNDKQPDKKHPLPATVPEFLTGNSRQLTIQPVSLPPEQWYPGMRPHIRKEMLAKAEATLREKERALQQTAPKIAASATSQSPAQAVKPIGVLRRKVARADLTAARSSLASLRARITADDARYASPPSADAARRAKTAAIAERRANLHAALAAVANAELEQLRTSQSDKANAKTLAAANTKRDAARKKLATVQAAVKIDDAKYSPLTETYPPTSTGRRLALAKWIANRTNPLTARVAVNHIWTRHFSTPLVTSTFDFGLNGQPPIHPELLDWLAVEFMEHGWSMKHLHRLIVTSDAYRRTSSSRGASPKILQADPDNRFLWRMNARRMEGEIVRDGVMFVAGQLDLTMGGPELPANLGQTTNRRSLYYRHAPEKFMTFLSIFDTASTHECYRRNETVVPQQSLAMINSSLVQEQSRKLTALINQQAKTETETEFVDRLFLRVLCRKPKNAERTACLEFLAAQTKQLQQMTKLSTFVGGTKVKTPPSSSPAIRARENLALVLLNHNEFITIR